MLAWTGPRLSFNSCLPAHVSVYKHLAYTPPTPAEGETKTRVVHVRKAIPQDESIKIYISWISDRRCIFPASYSP